MSVLPTVFKKDQVMEMGLGLQDRSVCWPHMNGAAPDHNLQSVEANQHSTPPISTESNAGGTMQAISLSHTTETSLPPVSTICQNPITAALANPNCNNTQMAGSGLQDFGPLKDDFRDLEVETALVGSCNQSSSISSSTLNYSDKGLERLKNEDRPSYPSPLHLPSPPTSNPSSAVLYRTPSTQPTNNLPPMGSFMQRPPTPLSAVKQNPQTDTFLKHEMSNKQEENKMSMHSLPPIAPTYSTLQPLGTAHHNLPPIAALTSFRPSSLARVKPTNANESVQTYKDRIAGPVFSAPGTSTAPSASSPKLATHINKSDSITFSSPPSPREKKDEHVFMPPNPPKPLQPAARAPTPFPEHTSSGLHAFHNAVQPIRLEPRNPADLGHVFKPIKSAFAAVPRGSPDVINSQKLTVPPLSPRVVLSSGSTSNSPASIEGEINPPSQGLTAPSASSSPSLPPSSQSFQTTSSYHNLPQDGGNPEDKKLPSAVCTPPPLQAQSAAKMSNPSHMVETGSDIILITPSLNQSKSLTTADEESRSQIQKTDPSIAANSALIQRTISNDMAATSPSVGPPNQSNYLTSRNDPEMLGQSEKKNNQVPFFNPDVVSHSNINNNPLSLSIPSESSKTNSSPSPRSQNPNLSSPGKYVYQSSPYLSISDNMARYSSNANSSPHQPIPSPIDAQARLANSQPRHERVRQNVPTSSADNFRRFSFATHNQSSPNIEDRNPGSMDGYNSLVSPTQRDSNRQYSQNSPQTFRQTSMHSLQSERNFNPQSSSVEMRNYPNMMYPEEVAGPTKPPDKENTYFKSANHSIQSDGRLQYPHRSSYNPHQNPSYPLQNNYRPNVPVTSSAPSNRPYPPSTNMPASDSFRGESSGQKDMQQNLLRGNYRPDFNSTEVRHDRPSHPPNSNAIPYSTANPSHAYRPPISTHDRGYPTHSLSNTDLSKMFQHRGDRPNYPFQSNQMGPSLGGTRPSFASSSTSGSQHAAMHSDKAMRYPTASVSIPSSTVITNMPHKKSEPQYLPSKDSTQHYPRGTIAVSSHNQSPYPANSHYYRPDPRQAWAPSNESRPVESASNLGMKQPIPIPTSKSLPQPSTSLHRNNLGYNTSQIPSYSQSSSSPKEKYSGYPVNSQPRANPPVVSMASHPHHFPRSSPSNAPYPTRLPPHQSPINSSSSLPYGVSRLTPNATSSPSANLQRGNFTPPSRLASPSASTSSVLPRVNFTPPTAATFSQSSQSITNTFAPHHSVSSAQLAHQQRHRQPPVRGDSKHLPSSAPSRQTSLLHSQSTLSHHHANPALRQIPGSYDHTMRQQSVDNAGGRLPGSPYMPSRSFPMESDTCRNPFELPAPSNQVKIIPTQGQPPAHYSERNNMVPKGTVSSAERLPQQGYDNFPSNIYPSNNTKLPERMQGPPSMRHYPQVSNELLRAGGEERPKPPPVSARFPPVPQSNFDLQRKIYDRMTGLQEGPPRLDKVNRSEMKTNAPPQMRLEEKSVTALKIDSLKQKRESPLDLSVKTVRQSADSTRDDVDLYLTKHFGQEPKLASAPKIDFNPNFAGPLVQETRSLISLPPVQSIKKFAPPTNELASSRKRSQIEEDAQIPRKVSKMEVDAWKLAMDEQIEEKFKAARPTRYPAAPLTPLHPPAQSVTPTNPELPPYAERSLHPIRAQAVEPGKVGARGWGQSTVQSSDSDPEHIIQQISKGMMPDTRLLHDRNVVDILRSSLEEKEARLQALQAEARRRQPLPSFGALPVERMCVPPSYPHGQLRGVEPVTIGVEPTRNYLRGSAPAAAGSNDREGTDLDGLAAFLAARIRTKAEMKQMGPTSENFRSPEAQTARSVITSGVTPPKENKGIGHLSRRNLMSPGSEEVSNTSAPLSRDPSGLRSSSETSVFDFRESDSETEMPVLERQTLDGMRRPRKTQPSRESMELIDARPGPAPKHHTMLAPDPAWDNVCDMFVEQLQKKPVKRSIRKKKPNPKFFANEAETPTFLKVNPDDVKKEPGVEDDNLTISQSSVPIKEEPATLPPLPLTVKEESSDDELIGFTVVKEGKVKMLAKKQRQTTTDSEWETSEVDSSSVEDSEVSSQSSDSEEESEDSTAEKLNRRNRNRSESDSNDETSRRRKGRRLRNREVVSASSGSSDESEENVKRRKTRAVVATDSDSSEVENKKVVRRTRSRALSDSEDEGMKKKNRRNRNAKGGKTDDEADNKDSLGKGGRIRTRQQMKSAPARMKLRSKKRAASKGAFKPGWEEDLIKFKQQLRMPDQLISVGKRKKQESPSLLPDSGDDSKKAGKKDKNLKKNKTEKTGDINRTKSKKAMKDKGDSDGEDDGISNDSGSSEASTRKKSGVITRGKEKMRHHRGRLRGNAGLRRSNKAVQNSKRHLNKGEKKKLKMRRKFRSGLDYMRKKKKQGQRKEEVQTPPIVEPKRKERSDFPDISAEIKTWVVNKSAGETILHRAARLGYADVAAYCLESLRLPPSPRDHAGYTPLHEACSRGHVAVARYLLQYGASVSESARGGVRPLHQAAENNHLEMVRLLLSYGADPLLATYTGQTALSLTNQEQVRILIKRHLADVQGDEAPKWLFDGPASVFDPKWAVDPLENPPSPDAGLLDVEIEASKAMLPPLYRLPSPSTEEDKSSQLWLLLVDLLAYLQAPSPDAVLSRLPHTERCEIPADDFKNRAVACNLMALPKTLGRKVQLIHYDDAVRKLLDIEITTVSLTD